MLWNWGVPPPGSCPSGKLLALHTFHPGWEVDLGIVKQVQWGGGHRKHRRVDLADLVGQTCGTPWTALDGSNVKVRGKWAFSLSESLLLSSLLKQLNQYTLTASVNNWLFIMHTYWCPENMRVKLEPPFSLKCHLFLPLNRHNPPLSLKGLLILGSWPRIL